MLSTQRAQSDSCPEFHLLIICLLAEHMVHFHAIRGTTNSWKSLTKNNVHKIRSSFLYSFVSDKKPDPCPIKINDYFGSCHLKILRKYQNFANWKLVLLCILKKKKKSQKPNFSTALRLKLKKCNTLINAQMKVGSSAYRQQFRSAIYTHHSVENR